MDPVGFRGHLKLHELQFGPEQSRSELGLPSTYTWSMAIYVVVVLVEVA